MLDGPAELAALAKVEARRLGFDLVGLTTPDPPNHLDVYARWLDAGRHAGMAYMASDRARRLRARPGDLLEGCRTILVVGMRYPPPQPPPAGQARIATYAGGRDYHDVIPLRLAELVLSLERSAGQTIPHKIYTDTGPILERELGQRAGLGWIGKNTCLIHPRQGSTFVLGEAFLGLRLPPDPPFTADRCGTCTRCIDACPTGCILSDRTLDAGRCLSYLTIEHRGSLPPSLRPSLDNWLFGCDICQEVCPWNRRFAAPASEIELRPASEQRHADPLELLALSEADFREAFRGTPLRRPKRQGLLRNAAVVLGNARREQAVAVMAERLREEPDPVVRAHLAWALGRIGGRAARQALVRAGQSEPDPSVAAEIQAASRQE